MPPFGHFSQMGIMRLFAGQETLALEVIHLLPAMEGIVLDHRSDPKTQETEKILNHLKLIIFP